MKNFPEYFQEIPIWDKNIPFTEPGDAKRKEIRPRDGGIIRIKNVTVPSITCFPVSGDGLKPAVLVCPGGAYEYTALHEGIEICGWLNQNGFSAFLLKYRCPQRRIAAHADAARAMRFLRANSKVLEIDPGRIGCIGFSAGGHLCATITAPADPVPYKPSGKIDKLSYRPDFTALIYPAYLADKETLALNPEFCVGKDTPPTFLVQTEDDAINVENSISWYLAMRRANRPCEMHLYADGGHGYSLFRRGFAVNDWHEAAGKWLRRQAGLL